MKNEIEHMTFMYAYNELHIKLKDVPLTGIPIKKLIKMLKKFDRK